MFEKAQKRHFRKIDTIAFDFQLSASVQKSLKDIKNAQSFEYNISQRGFVARLICELTADLTDEEKLIRKIAIIEARAALCSRQETQRRSRPKFTCKQEEQETTLKILKRTLKIYSS